jgi:hypothetical protein
MIEESAKGELDLRWMVLLGLRDNELPEPAKATTRARMVMRRRPSLWPRAQRGETILADGNRMRGEGATANTLKELHLVEIIECGCRNASEMG